jgi:hypothetical protein
MGKYLKKERVQELNDINGQIQGENKELKSKVQQLGVEKEVQTK